MSVGVPVATREKYYGILCSSLGAKVDKLSPQTFSFFVEKHKKMFCVCIEF